MDSNSLRGRGTSLHCRTAACVSLMASTSVCLCWTLRVATRIASRDWLPRLASPSRATCSTWQNRLGRTASHAAASHQARSSARWAASAAATASCTARSAWCSQARPRPRRATPRHAAAISPAAAPATARHCTPPRATTRHHTPPRHRESGCASQESCCSSPSGATAASPSSSARAYASCGTSAPRSTRTATR